MIIGLLIALCMLLVLLVLWSTWKLEVRLLNAPKPEATPEALRTWFFQEQAFGSRPGSVAKPMANRGPPRA